MKGFDIYERLDQLLDTDPFKNFFEFTYIGNMPVGVSFKNATVIAPTWGVKLASLLKQHHVYVTAARHEPGPNHCVEGLRCGLPVLYLKSGALPEYCEPYGIGFTLINFEEKLLEMQERYPELREKVLECPYTGTWMASQYEELFLRLVAERRESPRPAPSFITHLRVRLRRPYRRITRLVELGKKGIKYIR